MARAIRLFILPHSWAPAEYMLSDLAFGWLETERLLLSCWHGKREACRGPHVPTILLLPRERGCLLNEPIPESLAFQINK